MQTTYPLRIDTQLVELAKLMRGARPVDRQRSVDILPSSLSPSPSLPSKSGIVSRQVGKFASSGSDAIDQNSKFKVSSDAT